MDNHEEFVCPVCGNEDLEKGDPEIQYNYGEINSLSIPWKCNDCNSEGESVYKCLFSKHSGIEESNTKIRVKDIEWVEDHGSEDLPVSVTFTIKGYTKIGLYDQILEYLEEKYGGEVVDFDYTVKYAK